jgi:hypothetical protein
MEHIQLVKKIFGSLLLAFQTFKLYPERCQSRQQAIAKLHSELVLFLAQHGLLGFEIQKEAVFYLDEVIYERTDRIADLIFTLYQEGIQWLEFQDGIGLDEIERFFEILDEYSRPTSNEEEEGLVARLWEAQLVNIVFQDTVVEEDLLPEVEQSKERISFLKEKTIPQLCSYLLSLPEDPEFAGSCPENDLDTGKLTHDEESLLQRMKNEEQLLDPVAEIFGTLAYACGNEKQSELFSGILDLLRDGINQAMKSQDIDTASRILMTLRQLSKLCGQGHWACELLENNFGEISKSNDLRSLIAGIKDPESFRLNELKKFLTALNPEAVHTIIPALLEVWSPSLRVIVMEAIAALTTQDIEQLSKFPENSDANVILIVIEVLGNLKTQRAAEILLGYMNHHSYQVVAHGFKTLAGMDGWFPYPVFDLIYHQNNNARRIALEYLGSRKCQTAERLLVDYLTSGSIKKAEKTFALECFRALGRCGSSVAYTFFRGILRNQTWFRKVFRSVEAEGASLGLQIMKIEEAKQTMGKVNYKPILPVFQKKTG